MKSDFSSMTKDVGSDDVECLVSTDDEAYTYNKRVNRLSAVQEHGMIVRAMDRGVPAEKIAEALELDVSTIRRRFRMLDGICKDAVEMLRETSCPMKSFEILRQMAPIRQVEAVDLMIGQNNFSTMFAKALLAATPQSQLVDPRKKKPTRGNPVTSEQIARMERELASLQSQVKSVEESFGIDNLHLTVAKGYVTKILSNPRIVRWIEQNRYEYPQGRSKALLPAPIQSGPEPHRTGLRQAQAPHARGRRTNRRGNLESRW